MAHQREESFVSQQPTLQDELKRIEAHLMSDNYGSETNIECSVSYKLYMTDLQQTMRVENDAVMKEPADSSLKQVVIYNPCKIYTSVFRSQRRRQRASSNVFGSSIGTFTVQCSACFKWRRVPTKEKYEAIRANISQIPFVCERAHEWQPHISCQTSTNISQDDHSLWAIDKPDIAQPPRGWERLLHIRSKGGTKFADIYYITPCGIRLRSMTDVERYLREHRHYEREGINLSQFSFRTPRPLQANYVRKQQYKRATKSNNDAGFQFHTPLEPIAAAPLSWAAPETHEEIRFGGPVFYCAQYGPIHIGDPRQPFARRETSQTPAE